VAHAWQAKGQTKQLCNQEAAAMLRRRIPSKHDSPEQNYPASFVITRITGKAQRHMKRHGHGD